MYNLLCLVKELDSKLFSRVSKASSTCTGLILFRRSVSFLAGSVRVHSVPKEVCQGVVARLNEGSQTVLVWANVHLARSRPKHPLKALATSSVLDPVLDAAFRLVNPARLPVVVVLSSELHGEGVVELLHGNLAVPVVVESSHKGVLLVVGDKDVQPKRIRIYCL